MPTGLAPAYPEQLRADVECYLERLRLGGHSSAAGPESSGDSAAVDGAERRESSRDLAGLEQAMRYSLLAPAKRIRPVLALATAQAIGRSPASFLPLAGAIELIHTYSLIHDDLPAMDDDDLRRGRPTCHVAFGEDVAILAGDGLYAEAFRLLLTEQQGAPADLLAAARELAAATGVQGMVGGQYIDVTGSASAGPDGLRRLHDLKTGRLIAASIECVLLLDGRQRDDRIPCLRSFARELGALFQIVDDILDVTGSHETLGKRQGADERLGKRTYVTEFGLDGARELAVRSHDRARAALAAAVPTGASGLEQITHFIATRTY